jgi:hypothetical protein
LLSGGAPEVGSPGSRRNSARFEPPGTAAAYIERLRYYFGGGVVMRKAIVSVLVAAAIAASMVWLTTKVEAQGVSQIVLSCTTPNPDSVSTNGCSSSQEAPIPSANSPEGLFVGGFWVWCQSPVGPSTPYGPDCAGSVYVAEISASGETYEATAVDGHSSPLNAKENQVEFTSTDGDVSCTLDVPNSVTHGGTTLSGTCNGVPITFSNANVQVTR